MKTLNDFFLSRPALTAGLLSHLWQSTVVAVLVLGLLLLGGRLSARTRRALAWLALAKFALPVCALVSPAGPLANLFGHGVNVDWLQLPAGLRPMMMPASAGAAAASPVGFMAREFWAVAACVWAAGFAFLLGFWAFRAGRLGCRLLATAEPLDGPLQAGVESAARRMGLAEPPACRCVEAGQGPGVLGVLAPVVLLPRGLEGLLLPGELEAILIHEFVHVRRRDSWWNFLQMLLVSAFWFNPAVWLLQRRLNIETEKSCDDQVLAITSNPETYASGIVKTVRFSLGLPQIGFASAAMPPVTSRLKEILSAARRPERRLLRMATLGAGVTLLAFSGYAGAIQSEPSGTPVPVAAVSAPAEMNTGKPSPASGPDAVYDAADVDRRPVVAHQPAPLYPPDLKQQRIGGEVLVEYIVGPEGNVLSAYAVSSTRREFESPAIHAISQWRFQPGLRGGHAVNVRMQVPIVFAVSPAAATPPAPPAAAAPPVAKIESLPVAPAAIAKPSHEPSPVMPPMAAEPQVKPIPAE